jgi:2-polyprenyl-3-methyl-5-hydroxy-6-metoxy-1,4-benzoquinol methylase
MIKNYKNLDKYNFSTKVGFNAVLLKLRYRHLSKYFKGKTCLELGCADGEGTKILMNYFDSTVAVDGSDKLIRKAQKEIRSEKVTFIRSYFEDFEISEKFDTILLAHVLEHVDNPEFVIKKVVEFLKENGVLIIDVPNANSIHRQAGVLMKMLKNKYQLNQADKSIGHKRVYDMERLLRDISASGLALVDKGGLFLKPFSNDQMGAILPKNAIEAFNSLGVKYPEIAAEIYVICKRRVK